MRIRVMLDIEAPAEYAEAAKVFNVSLQDVGEYYMHRHVDSIVNMYRILQKAKEKKAT